jgi:alanine racemase
MPANLPDEILSYEAGTVLTIDLDALVANWRTLQTVCGEAECGAVVKADAYGLGLRPVVTALRAAGCKTFFVGHTFEGRDVRALAPDATIYVLNGFRPRTGHVFADHTLRPVLCSVPEMEDFGQFCATSGRHWPDGSKLKVGFHLDIGQHRLGLGAYDLERADHLVPLFDLTLLVGDLARTEDICRAERQIDVFDRMRERFPGCPVSIANSSAIFRDDIPLYDLVRPGYALYGGNPVPGRPNPMRPVVKLEAQIIALRILEPGTRVGDSPGWRAGGPRRVAVIAAGLGDGIPAAFTDNPRQSGGVALVHGKPCTFVGTIGMDHSVLDVTDATYLERGEWVELIGKRQGIDAFAAGAGRHGAEVLVHLGRRCFRRYQKI